MRERRYAGAGQRHAAALCTREQDGAGHLRVGQTGSVLQNYDDCYKKKVNEISVMRGDQKEIKMCPLMLRSSVTRIFGLALGTR